MALQRPHTHLPTLPQGKVDPARRNYRAIFAEMLAHKQVRRRGGPLACGCTAAACLVPGPRCRSRSGVE